MTNEDIERKCHQYAREATPAYTNGDFDRYAIAQAFEEGAKWRINSVWHDTSEIPKIENENILAIGEDDIVMPIRLCENLQESWADRMKYLHIKKWAYVKDLLPIKEDQK